jgi:hypothetical protein
MLLFPTEPTRVDVAMGKTVGLLNDGFGWLFDESGFPDKLECFLSALTVSIVDAEEGDTDGECSDKVDDEIRVRETTTPSSSSDETAEEEGPDDSSVRTPLLPNLPPDLEGRSPCCVELTTSREAWVEAVAQADDRSFNKSEPPKLLLPCLLVGRRWSPAFMFPWSSDWTNSPCDDKVVVVDDAKLLLLLSSMLMLLLLLLKLLLSLFRSICREWSSSTTAEADSALTFRLSTVPPPRRSDDEVWSVEGNSLL